MPARCCRLLFPGFAFVLLLWACTSAGAQSYSETILYTVQTVTGNGGDPNAVIQASDGNFYTTTFYGGASSGGAFGMGSGTVLRMSPAGAVAVLHVFCADTPCTEPTNPSGNLIQATDGNLYGISTYGGLYGQGTVFKVTIGGTVTTLYSFCAKTDCPDGAEPEGNLVQGMDGALYGHAMYGGSGNAGTIFKVTLAGKESVVYELNGTSVSSTPVQGSDGNFYGTASGGTYSAGQIYKLTTAGYFSTVYSFCSVVVSSVCTDGSYPQDSTLVEGTDGEFYGTTSSGGTGTGYSFPSGGGTLFKITTGGMLTTLHSFCSVTNCADGAAPSSGVTLGSDGAFYGFATAGGGPADEGVFYRFTGNSESSTFDTSWDFCQQNQVGVCTDVVQPATQAVQGQDGNFYASDDQYYADGAPYAGAIFKMVSTRGLPGPIVFTLSSSTVVEGGTFTLGYSAVNATSDTMQQCFASSSGTFAGWSGILTASPSVQTVTLTAPEATGAYSLALTCGGIESSSVNLQVDAGTPVNTKTTLVASPNPAAVGKAVTFTATVAPVSGFTKPTGAVSFYYGSVLLGSAALSDGSASFTVPTQELPVGSYVVTANYSQTENFNVSSGSATAVILADATTTALVANPTSLTPPAAVTFTATVARQGGAMGVPTGSVSFYVGTALLATENLNGSGVATYSLANTSGLPAGTYTLTAKYLGDASDGVSASSAESVVVK